MTQELNAWIQIVSAIDYGSAEEEEFYRYLAVFLQTLDPEMLPQLRYLYEQISDTDESMKAFQICYTIKQHLPDIIVKETFVRYIQQ